MGKSLKVALIQFDAKPEKAERNLREMRGLAGQAHRRTDAGNKPRRQVVDVRLQGRMRSLWRGWGSPGRCQSRRQGRDPTLQDQGELSSPALAPMPSPPYIPAALSSAAGLIGLPPASMLALTAKPIAADFKPSS